MLTQTSLWNLNDYSRFNACRPGTSVQLNARLVIEDVGFNGYTIAAGETEMYRVAAAD